MILLIAGPTGSGKSALAMEIARKYHGEIINGDAFQVYQDLNIGTAKPSKKDREEIPHHLFDFISPHIDYNVKNYQQDVRKAIENILLRHQLPIIVGGTGLYQLAGLYDYTFHDEDTIVDLSDLEDYSDEQLHAYLASFDEKESQMIHPHNRKRVLRAIAIYRATGLHKSDIIAQQKHMLVYPDVVMVGLDMPRVELYERIDERVDNMFKQGLVAEVRLILLKYGENHHALAAIGYKETIAYLHGKMSLEETQDLIKKHTRNYAKRQFTFFKNKLPIRWFNSPVEVLEYLKGEAKNYE